MSTKTIKLNYQISMSFFREGGTAAFGVFALEKN